jgi:hypothetical protein
MAAPSELQNDSAFNSSHSAGESLLNQQHQQHLHNEPAPAAQPRNATTSPNASSSSSHGGIFSIKYWQSLFDVTAVEVGRRLLVATMLPFRPTLAEELTHKSDLYAPFWICATLVFSTTGMASLASFVSSGLLGQHSGASRIAATSGTFFGYTFIAPLLCSAFHSYALQQPSPRLPLLIGAYGYSLAIFVPVSCACVAFADGSGLSNDRFLAPRLALCIAASAWSGLFLAVNVISASSLEGFRRGVLFVMLLLCHCGLGAALALAQPFFNYPINSGDSSNQR